MSTVAGTNAVSTALTADERAIASAQKQFRPNGFWHHPLRFLRSRLRMAVKTLPISDCWGLDRGLPAHRYYLQNFLTEHRRDIRGVCLEFSDPTYLKQFGGTQVTHMDVMNLDDSSEHATVIGDVTKLEMIPSNTYDCIISTHVLNCIYDLRGAVRGLHQMLKPGGVLLVAEPQQCMHAAEYNDMWRFVPQSIRALLHESFHPDSVDVRSYGNSLVAAAELRGLVCDEFTFEELNTHDPRFGVEICARAVKTR